MKAHNNKRRAIGSLPGKKADSRLNRARRDTVQSKLAVLRKQIDRLRVRVVESSQNRLLRTQLVPQCVASLLSLHKLGFQQLSPHELKLNRVGKRCGYQRR